MDDALKIIDYKPEYKSHFETLNKSWIEEFFQLEAYDEYLLQNPEGAILKNGGRIFFAEYKGRVIGTVAMLKVDDKTFELSKMGVEKSFRRLGSAKLLCKTVFQEALKLNAEKIVLYSNTRLSAALNLYRQLGFIELPVDKTDYQRANIKMQRDLKAPSLNEIGILLQSYGNAYNKIKSLLDQIPKDVWNWQPSYNKWTIHQNIIHLVDSEVHSYVRCRRFLAEPGSEVLGYDQDKWANELFYNKQNIKDALELFRLLRKMSYELIKNIPDEMWECTITHSERGTIKFWEWLKTYENHTHILQIKRVYEDWKQQ